MCLPFRNLDQTEQNFQDPSFKEPPKESGGLSSRLLRLGESDSIDEISINCRWYIGVVLLCRLNNMSRHKKSHCNRC